MPETVRRNTTNLSQYLNFQSLKYMKLLVSAGIRSLIMLWLAAILGCICRRSLKLPSLVRL